jgi:hypothetical protein
MLDNVTDIAVVAKLNALHHATVFDVQARE